MILGIKIQDEHLHASTMYEPTSASHFWKLLASILIAKFLRAKSVNVHLPLEILHPSIYTNKKIGILFVRFGEFLKRLFCIELYWENAPLLKYGTWDLKHGQSDWRLVPDDIDLCLDTGHLMLGAISTKQARERILHILKLRGKQIKHIHLHENDLIHDSHQQHSFIITPDLRNIITAGRSFILEP